MESFSQGIASTPAYSLRLVAEAIRDYLMPNRPALSGFEEE